MLNFAYEKNIALFIDKDGVLNEDSDDYVSSIDEIVMISKAGEALRPISQKDVPIFIISNQSGFGLGYFSETKAKLMFDTVIRNLEEKGVHVSDYCFCSHIPEDNCLCCKPNTALFQEAANEHGFELSQTAFIGDNLCDYEAAKRLGIPFFLVNSGKGEKTARILRKQNVIIKPKTLSEISNH
ncbi:MAG TPA: HAD-IIIA family hydrolase, partial [Candidatus Marinimicrobia bacterium]|nr:HAD-IIIA family hydrolase [Candidatus Neomarinimicrobiota bacterium]